MSDTDHRTASCLIKEQQKLPWDGDPLSPTLLSLLKDSTATISSVRMSLWVKASSSYSNFRHRWTSGVDTDFVPHAQKGKTADFSPHLTPFLCSCCLHVRISIQSLFDGKPLTGQQIKGYVGVSAVVLWNEVLCGEEEKWGKLLPIAGFTLDLIVILPVSHSPKHPLRHFQSQRLWQVKVR